MSKYRDTETLDLVIFDLFGEMRERIFVDGIAEDGGKIGQYSTKPASFGINSGPKKITPSKKGGKTRFFEDGYKGYRAAQNRQSQFVDLRLTGTLRESFIVERKGKEWVAGFINPQQAMIATANEDRFGKTVFAHTVAELNKIGDLLEHHSQGGQL